MINARDHLQVSDKKRYRDVTWISRHILFLLRYVESILSNSRVNSGERLYGKRRPKNIRNINFLRQLTKKK